MLIAERTVETPDAFPWTRQSLCTYSRRLCQFRNRFLSGSERNRAGNSEQPGNQRFREFVCMNKTPETNPPKLSRISRNLPRTRERDLDREIVASPCEKGGKRKNAERAGSRRFLVTRVVSFFASEVKAPREEPSS
jgi:hypothetical protein